MVGNPQRGGFDSLEIRLVLLGSSRRTRSDAGPGTMQMPYNINRLFESLKHLTKTKRPVTMAQLCGIEANTPDLMVARSDVERDPRHALRFARGLHERGIPGTLYFHTRKGCYDPAVFAKIRDLGHEVGYHHECLDRCRGDFQKARELFLRETERFRRDGFPVDTVCSHGENGIVRTGYTFNGELFLHFPKLLEEAGVKAEVYTTIKGRWEQTYTSDVLSGYRDFWAGLERGGQARRLHQILIHPHRWRAWFGPTFVEVARDLKQLVSNKFRKARDYATIWDEDQR